MDKKLSKLMILLLSGAVLSACGTGTETEDPAPAEDEVDDTAEVDTDAENEDTEDTEDTESTEGEEIEFSVDIFVEDEAVADLSKEITAEEGDYLLDVMKDEYDMDEEGGFVESIEGYEQDEDEELYWMYYVNDEMSDVGAADYELEEADQVEWKLESFE